MNKKIIVTLLSFLMLTTFMACGKDNKENGVDSSKSTTLLTQINEAKPEHIIDPFENIKVFFGTEYGSKYVLGFPLYQGESSYKELDITYISNIDNKGEYEVIDFINDKFVLKATLDDDQKDKLDEKFGEGNWELSRTIKEFSYKDDVFTTSNLYGTKGTVFEGLIIPVNNAKTYNLIVDQLDKYIINLIYTEMPGHDFVLKNKIMSMKKSIINNIETNYVYDNYSFKYFYQDSQGEIITVTPYNLYFKLDGTLLTDLVIGKDENLELDSGTDGFSVILQVDTFKLDRYVYTEKEKKEYSRFFRVYDGFIDRKPTLDMAKDFEATFDPIKGEPERHLYSYIELPLSGPIKEEDIPKDFYKVYVPEEFKEEETPVRSNKPKEEQDNYSPVVTTDAADYYLNTTILTAKKN